MSCDRFHYQGFNHIPYALCVTVLMLMLIGGARRTRVSGGRVDMSMDMEGQIEEVAIELYPEHQMWVLRMTDVTNAGKVKKSVMKGELGEVAVVDAGVVVSLRALVLAATSALTAHAAGAMRSLALPSELLVGLSPTAQVSFAFKNIGLSSSSSSLVFVWITHPGQAGKTPSLPHDLAAPVLSCVKGVAVDPSTPWSQLWDLHRIRNIYSLQESNQQSEQESNQESNQEAEQESNQQSEQDIEAAVIQAMALRDI